MPTDVELPLPGSVPDARVKLHLFRSGTVRSPPGWFVREPGLMGRVRGLGLGGGERIEAPIVSFLAEHPEGGPILIDTGLHPSVGDDLSGNFGGLNAFAFRGMRLSPEGPVREQIEARGIDPGAIRTVVMTHLHVDHASAIARFPSTTILVSRPEWEAATARDAGLNGYYTPQFQAPVDYRLLDFDGPAAAPARGFEKTLDLFGDGSLVAAFTPGHTHGHLSLIARTAAGDVLICGDAIYTLENLEAGKVPLKVAGGRAYQRSVEQLRAFTAAHPDAIVIPGHDARHWATLAARY